MAKTMQKIFRPIHDLFDPANITGWDETKSSEYERAVSKYRDQYYDAKKRGIPVELLGYKIAPTIIKSSKFGMPGFSGAGSGLGMSAGGINEATEQMIADINTQTAQLANTVAELEEAKAEVAREPIDVKHDPAATDGREHKTGYEEPTHDVSMTPGRKPTTLAGTTGGKKARTALLETNNLVPAGVVKTILIRLLTTSRSALRLNTPDEMSANRFINRVWRDRLDFQREVTRLIEEAGVYFPEYNTEANKNPSAISTNMADQIMRLPAITVARLHNQIMNAIIKAAKDDDEAALFKKTVQFIDTANLVPEAIPTHSTVPISEIPMLRTTISQILFGRGVERDVADAWAAKLIERFDIITAEHIGTVGDTDTARIQSADLMGRYIEDVQRALEKDFGTAQFNVHNAAKLIGQTIWDTRKALGTIPGMSAWDKFNTVSTGFDEIKRPYKPPNRLSGFNSILKGVSKSMFDRRADQTLRPTDPNIRTTSFPIGPVGGDPSAGRAVGNIILESVSDVARFLRSLGEQDDVVRIGAFRVGSADPDPGDPNDPGGGAGARLIVNTPRWNFNVSRANLIKALVVIGIQAGAIAGVIEIIKKHTSSAAVVKDSSTYKKDQKPKDADTGDTFVKIDNKNKDVKVVDYKDVPKWWRDEMEDTVLPPNKAPMHQISETGATRVGLTTQLKEAGLEDVINNYNDTVDEYNSSMNADDKSRLRNKLNSIFTTISDTIELKDRPDDKTSVPAKFSFKFPNILKKGFIDETMQGDSLANKVELTDEMKKQGLTQSVQIYNMLVDQYNDAFTRGDVDKKRSSLYTLYKFRSNMATERETPASKIKLTDQAAVRDNYLTDIDIYKNKLNEAVMSDAPSQTIQRIYDKLNELTSAYTSTTRKDAALEHPSTYLADMFKERFPTTSSEIRQFNKLQQYEAILHTKVNPNDRTNQAVQEYDGFVFAQDPQKLDASGYYDLRIKKIKELFKTHKFPDEQLKSLTDVADVEDEEIDTYVDFATPIETQEEVKDTIDARPMALDGGDALVLLTTEKERARENRDWANYSFIDPGYGNGRNNSLYRENIRNQNLIYQRNIPKRMFTHLPCPPPTRMIAAEPRLIPVYQFDTSFRDEFNNDLFTFTPELSTSVRQSDYENDHSNFHPDLVLQRVVPRAVRIPQIRLDGQRFAPYTYTNGEAKHGIGGVSNEHVPYDDAYGFQSKVPSDCYEFEMAKKKY